jgi:hypothetical protein
MFNYQTSLLTKTKTFVSYYHKEDQAYKNAFENAFKHLFINKSVAQGDIDTDLSTDYIKRLIQKDYITDSSVLVVLVGTKTYCRKHVDWELSAALNSKVGGPSGLMGILLPTFPLVNNTYKYDDLPPRLADNIKSGYAKVYAWNTVCSNDANIKEAINDAFNARKSRSNKIDNSRIQFVNNRCD